MRRVSRFAMALLLLNLSLVGWDLACAHEAEALEQPTSTDHGGPQTHHGPVPSEPDGPPCDESSTQCCDALASCAVSGVPECTFTEIVAPSVEFVLIAGTDSHLASAPLEVATPPPRA